MGLFDPPPSVTPTFVQEMLRRLRPEKPSPLSIPERPITATEITMRARDANPYAPVHDPDVLRQIEAMRRAAMQSVTMQVGINDHQADALKYLHGGGGQAAAGYYDARLMAGTPSQSQEELLRAMKAHQEEAARRSKRILDVWRHQKPHWRPTREGDAHSCFDWLPGDEPLPPGTAMSKITFYARVLRGLDGSAMVEVFTAGEGPRTGLTVGYMPLHNANES
jgi:hypothetical protein